MKKLHIVAICFLLSLFSCKEAKIEEKPKDDVIPVKIMTLEKKDQAQTYRLSGRFTTEDESALSFKNGGVIRTIYVNEGDKIQKGQLLAIVDKTEIGSMVNQAEIALEKAKRDFTRASNLYKDSVATLEQMQNARTALDIAQQQVVNARYNMNASEIRATQSGFVLKKYAQEGQIVGPGTPILLINGASKGKWILKAGVSDRHWAAIRLGDHASVISDAFPEQTMQGEVVAKSEGIDPSTGTFSINIRIKDDGRNKLATGLFGKAIIQSSSRIAAWTVPFSAVLEGDKENGYVFVVDDDHIAHKILVKIERIQHPDIIISTGLEGFKKLITEGNAYLKEGSKVTWNK